jgi:hypothetical protein
MFIEEIEYDFFMPFYVDFFMPFDFLNKNIKLKSEEQIFYNHQMDDRKSCVLTSQIVFEHPANRQLIPKNLDLDYVEQLYTESSSENDDNADDFQPLFEPPKRKFKSKVSTNTFGNKNSFLFLFILILFLV